MCEKSDKKATNENSIEVKLTPKGFLCCAIAKYFGCDVVDERSLNVWNDFTRYMVNNGYLEAT